jgi:hypothetical protein
MPHTKGGKEEEGWVLGLAGQSGCVERGVGNTKNHPPRSIAANEVHTTGVIPKTLIATVKLVCLDGCPSTFFFPHTVGPRFCLIKARSCKTVSTRSTKRTVPCVICVHWVGWQPLLLICQTPQPPGQMRVNPALFLRSDRLFAPPTPPGPNHAGTSSRAAPQTATRGRR